MNENDWKKLRCQKMGKRNVITIKKIFKGIAPCICGIRFVNSKPENVEDISSM